MVVWQQPPWTNLINIQKTLITETHRNTHTPELKKKIDVESQTSPVQKTSLQDSGFDTERFQENQIRNTPVQCLNNSQVCQTEPMKRMLTQQPITVEMAISPLPKSELHKSKKDSYGITLQNELHMPLSSTVILKRKSRLVCVPLDFENGLTIEALIDSRAHVSEIAENELDRIGQQAPANIFKIDDSPTFQI